MLRGLGAVLVVAFASLHVQLMGLVGARGIAPAATLLAAAREELGLAAAVWRLPTWLWLWSSDAALHAVCAGGLACGLLVLAGRAPRSALLGAWSAYLSLVAVGDVFLSYQWDALLLESALLGVFLAGPRPAVGIHCLRLLLVKLMLLSGLVKLLSGDPSWRDLGALQFHFWTQPLPTWTSPFAAELPGALLAAGTAFTFLGELAAPLGLLGPRRLRMASAAVIAGLQLAIAATGNYGFFNLLTLVLCAACLDDDALRALCPPALRRRLGQPAAKVTAPPPASWRGAAVLVAAILLVFLGALAGVARVLPRGALPGPARSLLTAVAPFRSTNAYGLFAVMTTDRLEIEVEGTRDGVTWQPLRFRWKPGPLDRRPAFAGPHMPRLDWQMWFAALSTCAREGWFHRFLTRLLEGSPDVWALLDGDPFPDGPPRFLRTSIARMRFAPPEERARGVWWTREAAEPWCPTVTLEGGRLVVATP